MNTRVKSIMVGVISVLSILILYFGVDYLKGYNPFGKETTFYAYYDNVSGLTEGSSVTVQGYKVGNVTDINYQNSERSLKVKFVVNDEIDIPENSVAKIVSVDLMGTKGINLILGDSENKANNNDVLFSSIELSLQDEVNAQILPLKNRAEELIGSIDSLLTVVTSVLDKDARSSLTKSLQSLDNTFSTLSSTVVKVDDLISKNEENVNDILTNVNHISTNIHESNGKIRNIINNFSSLSDTLSKTDLSEKIKKIDNVLNQLNSNQGFLGKLLNDKDLYNDLRLVLKEIDELIVDMKNNPKRYVNFSIIGNNKPYVKPKDE